MISRNHYIIHDIMGVNISTDIIIMRMISKIVIYDIMIVISGYDFMESLHHI